MELAYWPADKDFGLPSVDIDSLETLAYISFCNAPVKLNPCLKSWFSFKDFQYPYLRAASGEYICTFQKISTYLRLKYYDPDTWLQENKDKVLPLKALIDDNLKPAVLSLLWLDKQTYESVTLPMYAKCCAYLSGNYFPSNLQQKFESAVLSQKNLSRDEKVVSKLYQNAANCLKAFSDLVADKPFILGDRPSSLDARLLSVLIPLYKITTIPNKRLYNCLITHRNLCAYVDRLLKSSFKDQVKPRQEAKAVGEFTRNDWIIPTVVASVAMVSYAINIGMMMKIEQ